MYMTFNEEVESEKAGVVRTVLAHRRGDFVWRQTWRVIIYCLDLLEESL